MTSAESESFEFEDPTPDAREVRLGQRTAALRQAVAVPAHIVASFMIAAGLNKEVLA